MKNRILILALAVIATTFAVIGCGKVASPTAPVADPAKVANGIVSYELIGYARNVQGTIQVLRGGIYATMTQNMALYDDDQVFLVSKNARFTAESAIQEVPDVTIQKGDEGYWNAELGTKNPPDPDWARCRAVFYPSYF